MVDILLRVVDLKVAYETMRGLLVAVDSASLDVYRGETFCLVGESGCGKSTLALSILRLLPPNARILSGSVLYEDIDLLKLDDSELQKIRGREIAIVFQNPMTSLNPVYRVGFQIAEVPVTHRGCSWNTAMRIATEQLSRVGIPDAEIRSRDYPHLYSGGMRQRAMIAMMTVSKPKLLIADEPTTALDVTIQAQILELLKDLKRDYGLTLILITHNFGIVAEMCDRVAVMYAGKVVELADVYELFENPLHPYTRGLIDCIRLRTKPKTRLTQIPGSPPDLVNPPLGCRFHPRCPHVMEVCKVREPQLLKYSKDHYVACHLHRKELGV